MYFASRDQFGQPLLILANCFQCRVLTSNSISVSSSGAIAAMYRPSGDQIGVWRCSDPGSIITFCVARSSTRIATFSGAIFPIQGASSNTSAFPFGDQLK